MNPCPVEVGSRWFSLRNGKLATVVAVRQFEGTGDWAAQCLIEGRKRWVSCGKDGPKGYRAENDKLVRRP